MRQLTSEGRTVLVSSHLVSEMSVTADHWIPSLAAEDTIGIDHHERAIVS